MAIRAFWAVLAFFLATTISFGIVETHLPMNRVTMLAPLVLGIAAAIAIYKEDFETAPWLARLAGVLIFVFGIPAASCDNFSNEGINRISCLIAAGGSKLMQGIMWLVGQG